MPKSSYRLKPTIPIGSVSDKKEGYEALVGSLDGYSVIETYPGFPTEKLLDGLRRAGYDGRVALAEDFCPLGAKAFRNRISDDLTEDRVFGRFTNKNYADYYDSQAIANFVSQHEGRVLVIGIGAYLFAKPGGKLFYADMTRWRLQQMYRDGVPVFFKGGIEGANLANFKRGYFVEWRMADRIKKLVWESADHFFFFDDSGLPATVSGDLIRLSLLDASSQPFRLVPYFDAGVWGGQWMAEKFGLGTNKHGKWAWGFDGVPEENSVVLAFKDGKTYEMPAINLVFFVPKLLMGERVWSRFGTEFPMRFDMLDTIGGQNLSLQVHPTTEYMQEQFNGHYTQEESYYILDTEPESEPCCYLGLKDDLTVPEFIEAAKRAQDKGFFDVEKYVNRYDARKHDHFLHPAGCVHASGRGCMVLEVSSTPYIFTFKLWDWQRVDFDGKPRPINLEHGSKVIQAGYDSMRTRTECVNALQLLSKKSGVSEEKTGLHANQFIETRRWKIQPLMTASVECHGSVNMLNLVEGEEIVVTYGLSSKNERKFFFAETFIVPEAVKSYAITNTGDKPAWILQAFIRN